MVGLLEMFTIKCKLFFYKIQNKKNFLIEKLCTISTFFKLVNFSKGAKSSTLMCKHNPIFP